MTTEINENQMEENWRIRRPGLIVDDDGKIQPIIMTEDLLNPIEQIFLELIKFSLLRRRDDGFSNYYDSYRKNHEGIPVSDELGFWGTMHGDECGVILTISIIVKWYTILENYRQFNGLDNWDEITVYLIECNRDWREERLKSPRYSIKYIGIENCILWYIKHYYFERFREPLIQWVQACECEFSPK